MSRINGKLSVKRYVCFRRAENFRSKTNFLVKQIHGNPDDLVATIKSWGISKVEYVKTCDAKFIPRLLRAPLFLGTIVIIAGEK